MSRFENCRSATRRVERLGQDLQDGARIVNDLLTLIEHAMRFFNRRKKTEEAEKLLST